MLPENTLSAGDLSHAKPEHHALREHLVVEHKIIEFSSSGKFPKDLRVKSS